MPIDDQPAPAPGSAAPVAAYLPNVPEALIGMLAAASLGAIWSSCSPDFGATSVIDRFAQVSPKVLIATPIPRTLSGKRLEVPVRKILLGTPLEQAADPDSLANPEVLKFFAPQDAR